MGGLAKVAPQFAIFFMVILLGSLGVPLTNGFIGEFILIKSVFDYSILLGIIAGLTVILASAYLLRFYGKAMFGKGNPAVLSSMKDLSFVEFTVLSSISAMVIAFGVFPHCVIELVNSSLDFIYTALKS
jgi:NADH-quinone oxidoreductase subunit M